MPSYLSVKYEAMASIWLAYLGIWTESRGNSLTLSEGEEKPAHQHL